MARQVLVRSAAQPGRRSELRRGRQPVAAQLVGWLVRDRGSLLLTVSGRSEIARAATRPSGRLLGQAHAEIELLKKAFAMTQKKVHEERLKPMSKDDT